MTTEEKNNLISYLKKYKKLNTYALCGLIIYIVSIMSLFIFVTDNQDQTEIYFALFILTLPIIGFVIQYTTNKTAKNVIKLLTNYNIITINKKIIKSYNKNDLLELAKQNKTINLMENEHSISMKNDLKKCTSVIELLNKYPNLEYINKFEQSYTINELISEYQYLIVDVCKKYIQTYSIEYKTSSMQSFQSF